MHFLRTLEVNFVIDESLLQNFILRTSLVMKSMFTFMEIDKDRRGSHHVEKERTDSPKHIQLQLLNRL